jgi:nucleoside-diphosphate-sugar epimerase
MKDKMKIDVIGGSGFIGSRLCRRLDEQKKDFYIIDKSSSFNFPEKTKIADVRSQMELMNSISQDSIIINLAAEHKDNVRPISLYDEVNVDGATNVCHLARKKNINTIIFTSSVAVYGEVSSEVDERSETNPSNDYGRTKLLAERVYKSWQEEEPLKRSLVIIRPTVVFGERNRGNVYNLLNQIYSKLFLMIGSGLNKKSMAYVENLAAFIDYSISFDPGIHVYNFVDKPDFTMNQLVAFVKKILGRNYHRHLRVPIFFALIIGKVFDLLAFATGKDYGISSIRVKKFCSESVFASSVSETGFVSPISFHTALEKTIQYEFMENNQDINVYYSE